MPFSLYPVPSDLDVLAASQLLQKRRDDQLAAASPQGKLVGKHPEQRSDEAFLANIYLEELGSCGWQSKRAGYFAYQVDGTPCNTETSLVPVFVKINEVQQAGLSVFNGRVYSPRH